MDQLQDKDVFIVKIPNKLKEFLKDPGNYTLGSEDETIGFVFGQAHVNPESDARDSSKVSGKRTGFRAVMQLDMPVKRQKVTETEKLTFDL